MILPDKVEPAPNELDYFAGDLMSGDWTVPAGNIWTFNCTYAERLGGGIDKGYKFERDCFNGTRNMITLLTYEIAG